MAKTQFSPKTSPMVYQNHLKTASFHLGTALLSFFSSFGYFQHYYWISIVGTPEGVYLFKKKKSAILLFSVVPYSIKTEAVTKSDSRPLLICKPSSHSNLYTFTYIYIYI